MPAQRPLPLCPLGSGGQAARSGNAPSSVSGKAPHPTPPSRRWNSVHLKSIEAISKEIVFTDLVASLVKICMENAGADRGLLLVREPQGLQVFALRDLEERSGPLSRAPGRDGQGRAFPVARGDRQLRVPHPRDGPARSGRWRISLRGRSLHPDAAPKSLLCMPLLHRKELVGILYLDNKLDHDTFTAQRVEVLRLLSGTCRHLHLQCPASSGPRGGRSRAPAQGAAHDAVPGRCSRGHLRGQHQSGAALREQRGSAHPGPGRAGRDPGGHPVPGLRCP